MIKKLLILLIFPMIFSCEALRKLNPGPLFPINEKDSRSGASSTAFGKDKVVKDILNRPINNKVYFKDITILIPEGTKLNDKKNRYSNNIVDVKTKIGLSMYFRSGPLQETVCPVGQKCEVIKYRCSEFEYCKIVGDKIYVLTSGYGGGSDDEDEIEERIAEINGFVKGTER